MNLVITGHNVTLKDDFKELVQHKLKKFERVFYNDATVNVTVTVEKNRETVEITIHQSGSYYRAESTTADMNESLDKVIHALLRQFRKNKSRLEKRLRSGSLDDLLPSFEDLEEEKNYEIVRTKKFPIKPMSTDEAILEMNMIGHKFFMFRNENGKDINVVYVRNDGNYGLLVPEDL